VEYGAKAKSGCIKDDVMLKRKDGVMPQGVVEGEADMHHNLRCGGRRSGKIED
jgi:hypothetical protein